MHGKSVGLLGLWNGTIMKWSQPIDNSQTCPWEWNSHENPMGNVPWDGVGWDSAQSMSHGTYGTIAM